MQANNKLPVLSIVTVCFNAKQKIEKTIENVDQLKTRYKDIFEIQYIVVDGASRDGTNDILACHWRQIDKLICEPDKGIYDAMNKAWAVADNHSYILFLGSGDKILNLPDVNSFQRAPIVLGDVMIGEKTLFRSRVSHKLMICNTVHHQAMFVDKTIAPEPPFDLSYCTYADFDFNQRLYKKKFQFFKDPGFVSFADPDGVSNKLKLKEVAAICRKNFGWSCYLLSTLYGLAHKFAKR